MFTRLRKNIGLLYARFYFRRDPDRVMTFTDAVKHARTAIVFMPVDQRQSESARLLLNYFQNKFRGSKLTIVLQEDTQSSFLNSVSCEVLRLKKDDVSPFAVPRKSVLRRIRRNEYDLALDLNLQFHLPSAFLCKASRSRIRVGFGYENADTFFNFQIIADKSRNIKTVYERVVSCLGMF